VPPEFPGRDFDMGHGWGRPPGADSYEPQGELAVLATTGDRPEDWLRAGMALQTVLLRAAEDGVFASVVTQPLELAGSRDEIRREIGLAQYPQMLLLLGFAPESVPTPRRGVCEVFGTTLPTHRTTR
jgi:hypothetical protein